MSESNYCTSCASPRCASVCPRCNLPTIVPSEGWSHPVLPKVEPIRAAAKEKGYAITEHGSYERDLDLVAIPWVDNACGVEELLSHICAAIDAKLVGPVEEKPHGRVAVTLQPNGWYRPIDLSIVPLIE